MFNHGINTVKSATDFGALVIANVGVPMYFGCAPVHMGGGFTGKPQIFNTFDAAASALGYSEDWRDANGDPKWNLCQAMYAQFEVFGKGPAIFYNLFDPATNKSAVTADDYDVSDHKVKLPQDGLIDAGLVVKNSSDTLTKGTQYEAYYDGENLVLGFSSLSDDLMSSSNFQTIIIPIESDSIAAAYFISRRFLRNKRHS